ncbi:hypothetical protein TCAL_11984 [Tigriopus californicus]|uniref:Uncharacterized protein n=1 Tax=Tigriopus californicus TaxID=6832 RepID=A0A553NVZ0_TIGCA|nr:hypothetical protein TCAL_11984 [Tigriopus californicus]
MANSKTVGPLLYEVDCHRRHSRRLGRRGPLNTLDTRLHADSHHCLEFLALLAVKSKVVIPPMSLDDAVHWLPVVAVAQELQSSRHHRRRRRRRNLPPVAGPVEIVVAPGVVRSDLP